MTVKFVALVPMRHESERVPGKNFRTFAGHPLFHHIVRSLQDCTLIDEIVIDTDSRTITEDAKTSFPKIRIIDRPEHLKSGMLPMNDVLLHDVSQVGADFYLQTHSTNPLLTSSTISRAIEMFLDNFPERDSLFSVNRIQARLWNEDGEAINHDVEILKRTQDLEPVFEENSCIYIFTRDSLEKHGNRIGSNPVMFEVDPIEAWDIDVESDFAIAEFIYRKRESDLK